MDKVIEIKRIFSELTQGITLKKIELILKSEHEEYNPIFSQVKFACLNSKPTEIASVLLDDTLFPTMTLQAIVNILCHELGHILDDFNRPQPGTGASINQVIKFERAANNIGVELYSRYYAPETYWYNHRDIKRMKRSHAHYTGRESRIGDTQLLNMPEAFFEKVAAV